MKTLFVLMALVFIAGISFSARSSDFDEAICNTRNTNFTCKAYALSKIPREACKMARIIALEGCLKEGIQCQAVDKDKVSKNVDGLYSCNTTAIGQVL